METPLISLVCIGILIVGVATMAVSSFQAVSTVTEALKGMEEQAADIRRTEIDAWDNLDIHGGDFYMTVENDGQTNLAQFSKWDVIARYESDGTEYLVRLEYTANNPPGDNHWTVDGIYLPEDDPEVWDPDILNPGEKVVLRVDVEPWMTRWTYGRITVSTPNGVTSQSIIYRRFN